MPTTTSIAWIALGANLGDRAATLNAAVRDLATLGQVITVSPWIETAAWGFPGAPPYLNGALQLATSLPPLALLHGLQHIEAAYGRVRSAPNAPRTLDLDLLLYDDQVIDTPKLVVPHPRLHERLFVLDPLAIIGRDVVHPLLHKTILELKTRLEADQATSTE